MPTAPRMNKPQGGYDFWADTLQPGLFGLYDRWTERKPWPTPAQIDAAVQNPQQLNRGLLDEYLENAVDMAVPFAKVGGLLAHMPIPEGGLFGITTWHGSPHKWTKPDISKVGTGEGAQAYGHGFYSAESQNVAKSYQDALSGTKGKGLTPERTYIIDGQKVPQSALFRDDINIIESVLAEHRGDADAAYAAAKADYQLAVNRYGEDDPSVKRFKSYFDKLADYRGKMLEVDTGHLYKLDIPDEDVARYLDWDKPLSEQSETVQKAAKKYVALFDDQSKVKRILGDNPTGEDLYELGQMLAPRSAYDAGTVPPITTEQLNNLGIPGIRYLDGSSRSAGEGTYNYVTFDPSRIKVLERNGEDLQGLLGR